jgi:hypothetical protein
MTKTTNAPNAGDAAGMVEAARAFNASCESCGSIGRCDLCMASFAASHAAALQRENARMRAALEHYADDNSWLCDTCDDPNWRCTPDTHRVANWQGRSQHGPDIARAALTGEEREVRDGDVLRQTL